MLDYTRSEIDCLFMLWLSLEQFFFDRKRTGWTTVEEQATGELC
jgi:hypothetical protein